MVVLSIAIGTKQGKLLLSRDFSDISRTLIEDCMNSLMQLIKENQEHTFVEHNNLRLTYLPLGSLYLLSINDKNSNILEDLEVLRAAQGALHRVLEGQTTEDRIYHSAIEIIFILDDIISLGYRNICTEAALVNALQMESANEEFLQRQKAQQEKDAKKRAIEWNNEQKKKAKAMKGVESADAFSPSSSSQSDFFNNSSVPDVFDLPETEPETTKTSTADKKKTLKLSKKKDKNESKKANKESKDIAAKLSNFEKEEEVFNPLNASVKFIVQERIGATMDIEGKMKDFEIKGELNFVIQNPKISKIAVLIKSDKKNQLGPKVPPNFNKKMWTEDSVLMPRDDKITFQPKMTVPAIKYSYSKGGNMAPFKLSVWLTEGSLQVECDFNTDQTWLSSLTNLTFLIPDLVSEPTVEDKVNSDFTFSSDSSSAWVIPCLSPDQPNASINLDLGSDAPAEDDLFPWTVEFKTETTFGDFNVESVKDLATDEDIKFETNTDITTKNFTVVN